jgi:hypothetical protein
MRAVARAGLRIFPTSRVALRGVVRPLITRSSGRDWNLQQALVTQEL